MGNECDGITRRLIRRPPGLIISAVALSIVLGACSAGGAASAPEPGVEEGGEPKPEAAASFAPASEGGEEPSADGQAVDEALIVRTGSLQLEAADFNGALTRAKAAIVGLGGYISSAESYLDGDLPSASVTYRIPSDRWDDGLAALKALATKVSGEQIQAVDVTRSVVDLDARLRNLRATESQLLAIMTQATKIPDILEVQSQLTTVRGDIEQLVAERDHLRDQASFGTLSVNWQAPFAAITAAQADWQPNRIVDDAIAQLVQLGQGLFGFAVWFAIVGLPLLLVGMLLVAAVVVVVRRIRRMRRSTTAPAADDTSPA